MGLRFVLLALLSKQPNTGYGLGRLLQRDLRHLWEVRLQQIYSELGRLERQGLVSVAKIELTNRPPKKRYSLTAAGEAALDAWLATRPEAFVHKDELQVQLFCLERIPAETVVRRLAERREQRNRESTALRERLAQTSRSDPSRLGELFTLEAALARTEAEAAWCGRVLGLLDGDVEAGDAQERRRA